jgi:hypothetical protein
MSEDYNKPYRIIRAADRPNLLDIADEVVMLSWPEFMMHDAVANNHWAGLYESFPEYQFCLIDSGSDTVIASANSIPFRYDGSPEDLPDEGWDWALQKGFDDLKTGKKPNALCALSITVHPAFREKGFSLKTLQSMKSIGQSQNLSALAAPVRPYLKSRYPLIAIEKYIRWHNDDGFPFDAWLRVHIRDGGRIIRPCSESMVISGTIAEWEEWAAMKFPESGSYTVSGALVPIDIDLDDNRGIYVEPNVWVYHSLKKI